MRTPFSIRCLLLRDPSCGALRRNDYRRRVGFQLAILSLVATASSPALAQSDTSPDDEIRPPPGTPGSTVADEPIELETPSAPGAKPEIQEPSPAPIPDRTVEERADEYDAIITSRTFVRMFRRRYLIGFLDPGPEDETIVPIYEYASLRVNRLDAPWGRDTVDIRLSAWGMIDMVDVSGERRLTGDLMDANVTGRLGPAHITLGRQLTQGGPSMVTRFDGLSMGYHHEVGFGIEGYGGLSVRPQFRQRREYVLLGSATDSLLRQPGALPDTSMTDGWLAGGRVSYRIPELLDVGGSFHERHERGELNRRWAAADLRFSPMNELVLGGVGMGDLDTGRLVEVRGFADVIPVDRLTTTAEVLHTSPALFLSRGSVLSVFSLDTVTETGGEASYRLTPTWTVAALGYHQWFSDDGTGYRLGGRTRARLGQLVAQARYNRVTEQDLGYHGIRGSLSLDVSRDWTATTALQQFFYDREIRDVRSSTYGSATIEFGAPDQFWRVMVGGFATRSPYARLEAEGMARLSIDLEHKGGRQP